jgi:hypothetical protein
MAKLLANGGWKVYLFSLRAAACGHDSWCRGAIIIAVVNIVVGIVCLGSQVKILWASAVSEVKDVLKCDQPSIVGK